MAGLFMPKMPQAPKIPEPTPPAPMPDQQSPAVLEARRQQQMGAMQRAGRSSTILTSPTYAGRTLGAG